MSARAGANPLAADLDHVLRHTEGLWDALRGQRLLVTGATGFFGCWLLESFLWANERRALGATVVAVTRDPAAFHRKAPHLAANASVRLVTGDVRHLDAGQLAGQLGERDPRFSHVIHAATDASAALLASHPLAMLDTVVQGTRAALQLAVDTGARRFLLTSSGAVYGRQPGDLTHVPEDFAGAPDPALPTSAYAEGKRAAEVMGACVQAELGLDVLIARCFAFVGPYLPLDAHFAIGNFIRDTLRDEPIRVAGDGTPLRSYLYAADLAVWLWTILLRGTPGRPYNVGSANAVTIAELAETVRASLGGARPVEVAGVPVPGAAPHRYVPDVSRAARELGLREHVALDDAIRRTAGWHARGDRVGTG